MPINNVTITPPATGSTLTIAEGKTITCTQDTALDEAVAMSSKAPKVSPTFTTQITTPKLLVSTALVDTNEGTIVADADLTLDAKVVGGLLIIRDGNNAGVALVLCDEATGAVMVSGDARWVVGADPGAGTSKYWINATSGGTIIRNRYAITQALKVIAIRVT